jgi:hypothetical protein
LITYFAWSVQCLPYSRKHRHIVIYKIWIQHSSYHECIYEYGVRPPDGSIRSIRRWYELFRDQLHILLVLMILRLRTFSCGILWKTRCTAKEWIHWMNSKSGSLQHSAVLQRTCYSMSDRRWTVGEMYAKLKMALIMKCFIPNTFHLSVKRLFQLMNKIQQTAPSYLFLFLSYRCLKSQQLFWCSLYILLLSDVIFGS